MQLSQAQDSLHYFNAEFDFQPGGTGVYYGAIRQLSKSLFAVNLYNRSNTRVAELHFQGKDLYTKEGSVTGFYADGSIQFTGNFHKNSLDGVWQSYYPSGQLCDSGMLRNNAPEGWWLSWYPDGKLRMVATFSAKRLKDVKDEMQRIYRPPSRTQAFSFGQYVYQQTIYTQMNEAINATHIVGPGAMQPLTNKMDMNVNSDSYSPPFNQCLVHGLYKSYFQDGRLKDSGYYQNGYKYGLWREWAKDLRLSGFYKHGKKRGEWKYYNNAGKFLYTRRYSKMGYELRKQG